MEEQRTIIVMDEEDAPLFPEQVPCTYWEARCDYAGRTNATAQWVLRRHIPSFYHSECYCQILLNESCHSDLASYEPEELQTCYRTILVDGYKKRKLAKIYTREEIQEGIYYRRGICTQLQRFYSSEQAIQWLQQCTSIPPWCQYCMKMFSVELLESLTPDDGKEQASSGEENANTISSKALR